MHKRERSCNSYMISLIQNYVSVLFLLVLKEKSQNLSFLGRPQRKQAVVTEQEISDQGFF